MSNNVNKSLWAVPAQPSYDVFTPSPQPPSPFNLTISPIQLMSETYTIINLNDTFNMMCRSTKPKKRNNLIK